MRKLTLTSLTLLASMIGGMAYASDEEAAAVEPKVEEATGAPSEAAATVEAETTPSESASEEAPK